MKVLHQCSWVKDKDVPDKSILVTGWAPRMKGKEVRSRCVLKDSATLVRDEFCCAIAISSISERTFVTRSLVRSSSGNW